MSGSLNHISGDRQKAQRYFVFGDVTKLNSQFSEATEYIMSIGEAQ